MSRIFNAVAAYARFFGGETGPAGLAEMRYVGKRIPPAARVVDIGGGEGKTANYLVRHAGLVLVVDQERTNLDGADNSIYEGSLSRLLRNRVSERVQPIRGDGTALPVADASVDAIVCCQVLEHLQEADQRRFFEECARCLRPDGVLAISTPNADYLDGHKFRFSALSRRCIPPAVVAKMPRSLRGPFLEQTVEEWEAKVGHYGHGCRAAALAALAARFGLTELDRRASHTWLTRFWLELMFTFPLAAMAASPLVRLLYEVESRLPAAPGINLLMTFRKQTVAQPMLSDLPRRARKQQVLSPNGATHSSARAPGGR